MYQLSTYEFQVLGPIRVDIIALVPAAHIAQAYNFQSYFRVTSGESIPADTDEKETCGRRWLFVTFILSIRWCYI